MGICDVVAGWKRAVLIAAVCVLVTHTVAQADTITIGTISADPVDEARAFKPFADYLASQLADDGIDQVRVKISANIAEAAEMLKASNIDLFVDSSVTASIVNNLSGSEFLVRRWKKARPEYRSVIFVSADSDIEALQDLSGKTIAFEEPFSTSGYILPALAIVRSDLDLFPLESTRQDPPIDKVGYVMSEDNETQMVWLERGIVAAAAMAEGDYERFVENALKPLRVIHETPFVPYHVVAHRAGLDPKIVRRTKEILLSAHESDSGAAALEAFERTSKFDEIPEALLSEVLALTPYFSKLDAGHKN